MLCSELYSRAGLSGLDRARNVPLWRMHLINSRLRLSWANWGGRGVERARGFFALISPFTFRHFFSLSLSLLSLSNSPSRSFYPSFFVSSSLSNSFTALWVCLPYSISAALFLSFSWPLGHFLHFSLFLNSALQACRVGRFEISLSTTAYYIHNAPIYLRARYSERSHALRPCEDLLSREKWIFIQYRDRTFCAFRNKLTLGWMLCMVRTSHLVHFAKSRTYLQKIGAAKIKMRINGRIRGRGKDEEEIGVAGGFSQWYANEIRREYDTSLVS